MEFTKEFFDESQKAWRENKVHKGYGVFAYRCKYIHNSGERCKKPVCSHLCDFCKQHNRVRMPN
jgi:hypothetical protein